MPSLEGAEMKNWRKMVGALCIVLAMVLGAFAGFAYARNAGIVGASPGAGTRDAGGASGPIAFSEETPETPASSGDTSLASSDSVVASDGQDVARKGSAAERRRVGCGAPGPRLPSAQWPPPFTTFSWVFCTLSTPVTVIAGQKYRIAEHKNVDYFPYWMGFYGPPGTLPPYSPPVPTKITVGNFFYTWGPSFGGPINAYPNTDGGSNVIMMVDFRWTETLIRPDVAQGSANLQVMNVAPTVFDVAQNPTPGFEGSPVDLFAEFSDPGLDDTWEYRWRFDNGEASNWRSVDKMSGGARGLFPDTYGPQGPGLSNAVRDLGGTFCVRWDRMDWGPTGQNRVPSLDELTPYDVLVLGVNHFHYNGGPMGDVLAGYMDAAGGPRRGRRPA